MRQTGIEKCWKARGPFEKQSWICDQHHQQKPFFQTLQSIIFSVRNSDHRERDLNPVLNEENPTSTGELYTALALCEILGLPFDPEILCRQYNRALGHGGLQPEPIVATWTLLIQNLNGCSKDLSFDLTKDSSPLIIGLDLQHFSQRSFLEPCYSITIKIPHDMFSKNLPIYIKNQNPLSSRAQVDVIGLMRTLNSFLVTNNSSKLRTISLAKRLHRYSHAPSGEMLEILCENERGEESLRNTCK